MDSRRPSREADPRSEDVLAIRGLRVSYETVSGVHQAVDEVDVTLARGEILGLVGESGSGKSSLALAIAGLLPSSATLDAEVLTIVGREVPLGDDRRSKRTRRSLLGRDVGVVFQDPTASLDPTMGVYAQMEEPLRVHTSLTGAQRAGRVDELLELTGLAGIPDFAHRYPHQLSGGQRQRVMIGLALACEPAVLIADEPTTALDVTVQAEILRLFARLRNDLGVSVLFVSHDLGVVGEIADRVAVMYDGRIVERGATEAILSSPRNPYTIALLSSAPRLGRGRGPLPVVEFDRQAVSDHDADSEGV